MCLDSTLFLALLMADQVGSCEVVNHILFPTDAKLQEYTHALAAAAEVVSHTHQGWQPRQIHPVFALLFAEEELFVPSYARITEVKHASDMLRRS